MIASDTLSLWPSLKTGDMHAALSRRDPAFDGAFYVGVKTTGIFCRPVCPSRTPNIGNCEFFPHVSGAMQAGYRACKRCAPLSPPAAPPWANRIIERMNNEPDHVLTAMDIRRAGADPAAAARYFKSRFGATPQALSRARRVGLALKWVRQGAGVDRARKAAGYSSESGFRNAVIDLFGVAPSEAAKGPTDPILACWMETPIGPLLAGATQRGVCLLEFVDRRGLATQLETLRKRLGRPIVPGANASLTRLEKELAAYFAGRSAVFSVPLDVPGTPFQVSVWEALRRVPPGTTASYADLAQSIGRKSAVRAVARANGDNRICLIIPCHRIIGSDGSLTGYAGGLWRKQWLLDHERAMSIGKAGAATMGHHQRGRA